MRRAGRAVIVLALLAVGCGPSPETEQVCRRAPELESSLVAVDASLESLEAMRPRLLQSSLAVLVGTLDVMSEVAPVSLLGHFEVLGESYARLDAAFAGVFYDGSVAVSDAGVAAAIEEIRGNRTLEALERVRRFVAERCVAGIDYSPPAGATPGSTLPGPPIVVDPDEEPETGFEDDRSAIRAFGSLIGDLAGIRLDDVQAECVGDALLDEAAVAGDRSDAYDNLVAEALAWCTRSPQTTSTSVG